MLQFFFTSVLFLLNCEKSFGKAKNLVLPPWTWECENGKCLPTRSTSVEKMQSLVTCNMLCGNVQLWPKPTGTVSLSSTGIPIRADLFQLRGVTASSQAVHDHVEKAFKIFRDTIVKLEKDIQGLAEWRAAAIQVTINGSGEPLLKMDTDESYELIVEPKYGPNGPLLINIFAKSFCGARHAFETLSQLVWLDSYFSSLFIIETATIIDKPQFSYRGIMLDTARNFFPMADILRTLDGMAASKLNTFHWRVSDSQSFSMGLKSFPELSLNGAFGLGASYSTLDVENIVQHARVRGIRVVIEVDTPAHVCSAWMLSMNRNRNTDNKSNDSIVICLNDNRYCNEPPCGHLNPMNNEIYDVLQDIYGEIIKLTGVDDVFHLGGDDISDRCWLEVLREKEPPELWYHFTKSILSRLETVNGKIPYLTIMWSSHFSDFIKIKLRDYEPYLGLQLRNSQWLSEYIRGIRTIISHEEPWDLNSGMGSWNDKTRARPYNSWQQVYEHRPWANKIDSSLVIGGEALVWSTVLSSGGLDSCVWPRAAALAERLWSDLPEGATRHVYIRLDIHRSRLLARGVHASPLWSMWCTQNPYTCG